MGSFIFISLVIFLKLLENSVGRVNCMSISEKLEMKEKVKEMFDFAFGKYKENAYGHDELKPMSCTYAKTLGNYSLTLIDSLDSLYIFGNTDEFLDGVDYVVRKVEFSTRNISVSLFETNIRILGGLLSAYLIIVDKISRFTSNPLRIFKMINDLYYKIVELGDILLKAFETGTKLPYGAVNLKYGVAEDEVRVTSVASCGTYLMEFGVLSSITNDMKYINAAREAAFALYNFRNRKTGMIGNHVNIMTGQYTHLDFGIGAGLDSYFEYLVKGYFLFGDEEYYYLFDKYYKVILDNLYQDSFYIEKKMNDQKTVWTVYNSLQTFWPGAVQSIMGDLGIGKETLNSFFSIWREFGCTPEGFNLVYHHPEGNQLGYPLRPELSESVYYLYRATKDPLYLRMGKDMVFSLDKLCRTDCGFANIKDVRNKNREDKMESFFLSETLKYLYLLFDENNFVNTEKYMFTTEAHIIPRLYNGFSVNVKKENKKGKEEEEEENEEEEEEDVVEEEEEEEVEVVDVLDDFDVGILEIEINDDDEEEEEEDDDDDDDDDNEQYNTFLEEELYEGLDMRTLNCPFEKNFGYLSQYTCCQLV